MIKLIENVLNSTSSDLRPNMFKIIFDRGSKQVIYYDMSDEDVDYLLDYIGKRYNREGILVTGEEARFHFKGFHFKGSELFFYINTNPLTHEHKFSYLRIELVYNFTEDKLSSNIL